MLDKCVGDCEVVASRFEGALSPGTCGRFFEECGGDADLFNGFSFIVKDGNLYVAFIEINAPGVICGHGIL
ncbi:MAG: hypothetical protein ABEH65_06605 [Halobacteriales archaeon]